MESNREIEEYFFRKLRELYPKIPDGSVSRPEPPDFIIDTGNESIAVEITQVHNQKGQNENFPPAQKHAAEDQILENAQKLFFLRNSIPLHVRFSFANNIILNEKQRQSLSSKISDIIEFEMQGKDFDKPFSFSLKEDLPKELLYISCYYFPNITGVSWYSAKGRLVPNLSKNEILNIISEKERKMKRYIDSVDKAILVIAEGIIPNSWFDKIETFEENELVSHFDKIFIIRYISNQLVELK
jgi:hypothetical protein